jgi:hypothetical protein
VYITSQPSEGSQLNVERVVRTLLPLLPQRLLQLAQPHVRVLLLQHRHPHLHSKRVHFYKDGHRTCPHNSVSDPRAHKTT